jgi:hypothetical protein
MSAGNDRCIALVLSDGIDCELQREQTRRACGIDRKARTSNATHLIGNLTQKTIIKNESNIRC